MLNEVLIDSGPLIALFDKDDKYHHRILNFIKTGRFRFITTIAVITEVLHMLDFNVEVQLLFLEWIANKGMSIFDIYQHDMARIIELTKKYRDRPMDFADASLVLAAKKTKIQKIISIDSDFDIYRLPKKEKIENVFRDFC
jgi:uncharacterized protein